MTEPVDFATTSRFADAGGMRLHYHEAGDAPGRIPVVVLHGGGPGTSAWSNFGRNLPVLAARFRTLMIDQPGFGSSAKPPVTGHYFTFAAEALARLLDKLGIGQVHLVGNSLGGGTSVRFALRYPGRVGRVVLMGPGGLSLNVFAPDPTEGVKRLMEFAAPPGPSREKMAAFLRTMVYDQRLVTDELVEERYVAASTPEAVAAMASMGASFYDPAHAEEGLLWREAQRLRHDVPLASGPRPPPHSPYTGTAFPRRSCAPGWGGERRRRRGPGDEGSRCQCRGNGEAGGAPMRAGNTVTGI